MELIFAIGFAVLALTYLFVHGENWIFKLLTLGLIISGMMLLGGAAHHETNCMTWVNETNQSMHQACLDDPVGSSNTTVVWASWIVRLYMIYIVGYLLFSVLNAFNKLPKVLKRKRRTNEIKERRRM